MIRDKFNLRCSDGHKHFAPEPELWIGRLCAKPFENPLTLAGDARKVVAKCDKPLSRIRRG